MQLRRLVAARDQENDQHCLHAGLVAGDASTIRQSREEFMAKWGIHSDQELRDITTILQIVARSQFQRLRPKWSQQFGEKTLKAIESMPTYYPSTSATPAAPMLTGYQD